MYIGKLYVKTYFKACRARPTYHSYSINQEGSSEYLRFSRSKVLIWSKITNFQHAAKKQKKKFSEKCDKSSTYVMDRMHVEYGNIIV